MGVLITLFRGVMALLAFQGGVLLMRKLDIPKFALQSQRFLHSPEQANRHKKRTSPYQDNQYPFSHSLVSPPLSGTFPQPLKKVK
jgi:hypothetical protein